MIKISELSFAYKKGCDVLLNINTTLEMGRVYGLLGKNGVGKTTLMKLLCGLLFPSSGKIEVLGSEPRHRKPSLKRDIFVVTEELDVPPLTMTQFVKLTSKLYPNFSHDKLVQYMNEFQVSMDVKLSTMSHGQKKKAIVSYGLACCTKVIIMDEPTNGMDIPSKTQFRKLISSLPIEDRCIIISTHQVRDLDGIIDSILLADGNSLIIDSTIEDISKKFIFAPTESVSEPIYTEQTPRGDVSIAYNSDGVTSKVDIEIFFNAVITNPSTMMKYFNL